MYTNRPPSTVLFAVIAALMLLLPACASRETVATVEPAGSVALGRFVIAPMNLGLTAPVELSADAAPVWDELIEHFQGMDRPVKVIDPADARAVWETAITEMRATGAEVGFATAAAHFARRLSDHSDYDLLVMPSLVLRKARVRGGRAHWDGVRRRMPVASTPSIGHVGGFAPSHATHVTSWGLRGSVPAISLHVLVVTPDGRTAYEGMGGLDVIQVAAPRNGDGRGSWDLADRTDTFMGREHLSQGISVAFERPLRRTTSAW